MAYQGIQWGHLLPGLLRQLGLAALVHSSEVGLEHLHGPGVHLASPSHRPSAWMQRHAAQPIFCLEGWA